MNLQLFRDTIASNFNLEELNNLCFDLNINFENLSGTTLHLKSKELVMYCDRYNKLSDLLEQCKKLRPNTSWQEIIRTSQDFEPRAKKREIKDGEMLITQASKLLPSQNPKTIILERKESEIVGRDDYIDRICKLIITKNQNKPRITVLYGQPGMGKTRLAKEIAILLNPNSKHTAFPNSLNSVLFHNVDRFAEQGDPHEALEKLVYELADILHIGRPNRSTTLMKHDVITEISKKQYNLLIILDGLRFEVEEVIMDFVESLPLSVKILITQNQKLRYNNVLLPCSHIKLTGLSKNYILDFLNSQIAFIGENEPPLNLDEKAINQIYKQTLGNAIALKAISNQGKENIEKNLNHILNETIDPNKDIARQWIGKTYNSLSAQRQALIKGQALFKTSSNSKILVEITKKVMKTDFSHSKVKQDIEYLVSHDILIADQVIGRYRMADPYWNYLRQKMIQDNQLDVWRNHWVDYYLNLRKRKGNFHDEAGWTIFSDYRTDEKKHINYSNEINNIIDVIKYCLAEKRAEEHWKKAAKLLDDFRATLFATGNWEKRIEFCETLFEYAKKYNEQQTASQVQRLRAWMYCFRDEYDDSLELVKDALNIARAGIQDKQQDQTKRIIYRQSYYKSLNTLGQIALRQGHTAALNGQIAGRKISSINNGNNIDLLAQIKQERSDYFRQALEKFDLARQYFYQAYGFVGAEFPKEQLIVKFHLAEVDYYDRHPRNPEDGDSRRKLSLQKSLKSFKSILSEAEIYFIPDGKETISKHERLIANTHYYLGKVLRRLVLIYPQNSDVYFKESFEYLEKAKKSARKFGDQVLEARVNFAIGQWYEQKMKMSENEVEEQNYLRQAKDMVEQSTLQLKEWGMYLESSDASAFLLHRLYGKSIFEQNNN